MTKSLKSVARGNAKARARKADERAGSPAVPPPAYDRPANSRTHGFYSTYFTPEELALLAEFVSDPTLDDEIWMQRVLNRRLLAHVTAPKDGDAQAVPLETLVKVAEALAAGTGRVARLLRDKRALSGEAADGIAGAIAAALDELSTELGVEL